MGGFAAVVLAGGAGRRMGGLDKPAITVGGRSMRDRVLAAVADAAPRVVVGPAVGLPIGVSVTREEPPGGGPVAAAAAGLALLDPGTATVALLAGDLPLLTVAAVRVLRRELAACAADGSCYIDDEGRRQTLCGVWRVTPLRDALAALAADRDGTLTGARMRDLLAALKVAEVSWASGGPPPWFDCDTDQDVRRAEEWTR